MSCQLHYAVHVKCDSYVVQTLVGIFEAASSIRSSIQFYFVCISIVYRIFGNCASLLRAEKEH